MTGRVMTGRMVRVAIMVAVVALVLVIPNAIYGCGPWFDEAVFTSSSEPQTSQEEFAAGNLGIVLPSMRRSYLIVAYRTLNGTKLNAAQQHEAMDVWNRNMGPGNPTEETEDGTALQAWEKAREQVRGAAQLEAVSRYATVAEDQPYQVFLNCPEDAFKTAEGTLNARVARYGAASAAVKEWLAAQDQVFANCDGKAQVVPVKLESADPLLRADRNYQIAAALFYQRRFGEAAAAFEAVGKDAASPWAPYGEYLAARAMVRKATLSSSEDGKFDMAGLRAAQARLEELVRSSQSGAPHGAAERLLDYLRFRTEPGKRVAELEQVMLKPDPGPEFKQHLWDYVLLVSHGEQAEDLSDWIKTFYTETTYEHPLGAPHADAQQEAKHALAKWRETKSMPWLIAALSLSDAKDAAELLKAAGQVPAGSPGYLSVRYYALRLMARGKDQDGARKELDALLSRPEGELAHGTRNLFNDERQKLSLSFADFLAHAAEVPEQIGWNMDGEDVGANPDADESERAKQDKGKAFFNDYSAEILAQRMPVSLLIESAKSKELPTPLRREVARSTWTRAAVLGNLAAADELQPVIADLDKPLWKAMEPYRSAKTDEEKGFAAALVTLENPGLSPYVRTGLLRGTTLGEIDNYRDNWWCEPLKIEGQQVRRDRDPSVPAPAFLTESERAQVDREMAKLGDAAVAPNILSQRVLEYANSHASDPRVPEALYLAVRATRYGCTDKETTQWSEKAFRLLHGRYPKSEWAEKTKYYY